MCALDLCTLGDGDAVVPTVRVLVAAGVGEHLLAAVRHLLQDGEQIVGDLNVAGLPRLRLPVLLWPNADDASREVNILPSEVFKLCFPQASHQERFENRVAVGVALLEKCRELVVVVHADFRLGELHVLDGDESLAGIELEHATDELVYAKALVRCCACGASLVNQVLLEAQQVIAPDVFDQVCGNEALNTPSLPVPMPE